jgi:hypothetical protein
MNKGKAEKQFPRLKSELSLLWAWDSNREETYTFYSLKSYVTRKFFQYYIYRFKYVGKGEQTFLKWL